MCRLSLISAALLLCACAPTFAQSKADLQQLLTSAEQHASLFDDQTAPFQLDVDLVVKAKVHGRLTLKWGAKDRWWRKLVLGNFQQIEVKSGDSRYTARNSEINPILIGDIFKLLDLDDNAGNLTAKKEKHRSEHGVNLNCIQVEGKFETSHRVCLDPATSDILSDEWKEAPDEQDSEKFTNYFYFGSHHYPHTLELRVNDKSVVTANVLDLTAAPFDESLLTPPPGAIARRECDGETAPKAISTPDVDFSGLPSNDKSPGDSTVAMTVLADGSVDDIHIVQGMTPSMDQVILKTLKLWKFTPAMCGTEPVVADITVVVSFRITS